MEIGVTQQTPLTKYGNEAIQSVVESPVDKYAALFTTYMSSCPIIVFKDGSFELPTDRGKFRNASHSVLLPDGTVIISDGSILYLLPPVVRPALRPVLRRGESDKTMSKTIAGSLEQGYRDGEALEVARFKRITALAYNPHDGSILIAANNRIRQLKDGIVSTLAGTGKRRTFAKDADDDDDDGEIDPDTPISITECSFALIHGIGVLSDGKIVVADGNKLRIITRDGEISTVETFNRHLDGLLVDADDNIYTCNVRFNEAAVENDEDVKTVTAVVKVHFVRKKSIVKYIVDFDSSPITCGRLLSFTKDGHLMIGDCSGVVHIVETSCRLKKTRRFSERLAALRDEEKEEA